MMTPGIKCMSLMMTPGIKCMRRRRHLFVKCYFSVCNIIWRCIRMTTYDALRTVYYYYYYYYMWSSNTTSVVVYCTLMGPEQNQLRSFSAKTFKYV